MRTRVALAAVGLATTALVGVAVLTPIGAASAATAKSVMLGKSNKATTTTTVQNTQGSALSLKAPSNKAPLAVSNSVTVKNLSADKLDGHSSGSFARSTGKTGTIAVLDGVALCPAGTVVTGGGGVPQASTDGISYSARAITDGGKTLNGWDAFATNDGSIIVIAECYSPSGKAIPGSIEAGAAANQLTAVQKKVIATRTHAAR
jgi:hypothetical protein